MYVINSLKLRRGDIILFRYPNDSLSQIIMKVTKSNYSHAMLYVDLDSIIEAGEIVTANNPLREAIENLDDACVLRLKPEYWNEMLIDKAIEYARLKIGMEYSVQEARNVINPPLTVAQPNRQICTRLVAKAFQEAGLSIVENPDYCSLSEFENSNKLEIVENAFIEVTPEIQEIIESENILDRQTEVITSLLKTCRDEFREDIQSIDQLHLFSTLHPQKNEQIASILKESGYLDLWQDEERLNKYNFNSDLFIEKYKNNAIQAVILNRMAVNQCEYRYKSNLMALLLEAFINGSNSYRACMIELYHSLVDQCERRKLVLNEVVYKIQHK